MGTGVSQCGCSVSNWKETVLAVELCMQHAWQAGREGWPIDTLRFRMGVYLQARGITDEQATQILAESKFADEKAGI